MKIAAIIGEYNPFHNGHLYQISKIKSMGYSVITIVSSSFTQRGTPSIIDKFTKTKLLLKSGVDLVIENPVVFSTSNAEIFAKGAIGILNSLGVVDKLVFGTEDDLKIISNINEKIEKNTFDINKKISKYLDEGLSFIVARNKSYDFLTENELKIINKPNNILAMEYLNSLKFFNSNIEPMSILRHKVSHHYDMVDKFASASFIRENINNSILIKNLIPKYSFDAISNSKLNNFNNYFDEFKYLLLSKKNLSIYTDYEIGLENRFLKYIDEENIYDFIDKVSSKRYTKSRISRLICHSLLDINKELIKSLIGVAYVRILGTSKAGFNIINNLDENLFIINKFSKINNLNDDSKIKKIANKEIFATNLYNIKLKKDINEDFYNGIIIGD